MTDVEHMIAWIESSRPHYERLCNLYANRISGAYKISLQAQIAANLAIDAYREATRGGDMFPEQWSAAAILEAAKALLTWELEQ